MNLKTHPTRGRSLKNTPAVDWYGQLIDKLNTFNRNQRLDGQPESTLRHFCKCRNIDLSGKELVDINKPIDLLNSAVSFKK